MIRLINRFLSGTYVSSRKVPVRVGRESFVSPSFSALASCLPSENGTAFGFVEKEESAAFFFGTRREISQNSSAFLSLSLIGSSSFSVNTSLYHKNRRLSIGKHAFFRKKTLPADVFSRGGRKNSDSFFLHKT